MRTGAWHQQKMNTQLAAWTQVRHDNLLYAKPSYTGGMGCSFPYSYVEPYPEFFKRLGDYANGAARFFSGKEIKVNYSKPVDQYFKQFAEVMSKLEILAQKELDNQPFSADEEEWLKQMLIKQIYQECGAMPFTGWILDLYWDERKVTESDFINVDIHTQPTDEFGNTVGKVLHAGLGEINIGVCLAKIPGSNKTAAYTGAFMSYYEYITDNFLRVNDQEWEKRVNNGNLPVRPEWVNSYLANGSGHAYPHEKSLPTTMLVGSKSIKTDDAGVFARIYPNPTTSFITIQVAETNRTRLNYAVFDMCGRQMKSGPVVFNNEPIDFTTFPKGIYVVKLSNGVVNQCIKVVKD